MAGAVALASTGYIAAIDEKAWAGPRRLAGRPGSHSVSRHCPRRQLESRVRERKVESSFWSGLDRSPVAAAGTGCSPANGTLRSLDDCSSLRVINSFTAPVLL